MRKLFTGILLLTVAATPLAAQQTCKPVTGHFLASYVPPGSAEFCAPDALFCTAGRVWGGIQGSYEFVMSGQFPAAAVGGGTASVLFFSGHSTIALQSGDTLLGTDTGAIDLPQLGGLGGFASLITMNGGTGTMSTATGQIRLRGEFSLTAGTTSGDYTGTLCSQ